MTDYSQIDQRIISEMNNEPCEKCGVKTRDVGSLLAKDTRDEFGRKIVLMLCPTCFKVIA